MRTFTALLATAWAIAAGMTAGGQTSASPQKTLVAVVLDFENRAGKEGEPLVRTATDTVAVELASTLRYEVLKRSEVERSAKGLGLRPPYDRIDQSKLAKALGADVIVTGEIAFVRRDTKRKPPQTRVGLRVRVIDPESGELIGGGASVGIAEEKDGKPVISLAHAPPAKGKR
jgi:hypothetical protein